MNYKVSDALIKVLGVSMGDSYVIEKDSSIEDFCCIAYYSIHNAIMAGVIEEPKDKEAFKKLANEIISLLEHIASSIKE